MNFIKFILKNIILFYCISFIESVLNTSIESPITIFLSEVMQQSWFGKMTHERKCMRDGRNI